MSLSGHTSFFSQIDWLLPELSGAEVLRREGNTSRAYGEVLKTVRKQLKTRMPELPRLDLCGNLAELADNLLERRVNLLNEIVELDTLVDWGKLGLTDPQRNWHLGYQYWLNALAHQYAETGDERYARQWCQYVTEFLDGCPYAADGRGYWPTRPMVQNDLKTCNLGENGGARVKEAPHNQQAQWMSLSCHFRIEAWLGGLARLADSPSLDDITLTRILESLLNDHAFVCVMNPRENTPNQFTAVTLSLLKLSLLLPVHRSCASTFLVAWQRLQRVYDNNLLPDGSDLEQSPDYNTFLLDLSIEVLELLKDAPGSRREPIKRAAQKRLRFLTSILMPGNLQPPIGKGHAEEKTGSFLNAARELGDAISTQALTQQRGPLRNSATFPYGGYHCLREDGSYLLFKNSRIGNGHMHEDCLSFLLWHKGVELLTDPSHYTYNMNTGEEVLLNTYALGTQGHNSICINGLGQRQLPLSKSGRRADDEVPELRAIDVQPAQDRICVGSSFAFLEGTYNNGYGANGEIAANHQRTIIHVFGQGWLVIDRLRDLPEGATIQQHWHLSAEFDAADARLISNTELQASNEKAHLRLLRLNQGKVSTKFLRGSMEPVQGWSFPKYGAKSPAWELVWESAAEAQTQSLFTWIESSLKGNAADVQWKSESKVSWLCGNAEKLVLNAVEDIFRLNSPIGSLCWKIHEDMPCETSLEGSTSELRPLTSPNQKNL